MKQDFQHDDPLNWKLGAFYVNGRNNRLIVPNRNKSLGWTLNFGHFKVWIGIAFITAILILSKLYL